ncbi:hypothetical protein CL634_04025 [bacterium]|nr:hypothetical protein [bacterium]|tara:strand:- start:1564 stop:1839 length:276 start_codon:yes stop_codon:yes gene_type:complete
MNENTLKLSDEAIGQIAKLVQLAILTGTDVVDNLRTLRLTSRSNELYLFEEYKENFHANIEKMLERAEEPPEEDSGEISIVPAGAPPKLFE